MGAPRNLAEIPLVLTRVPPEPAAEAGRPDAAATDQPLTAAAIGAAREPLCAMARRLTGRADVDDLVQDTLARALAFSHRFDPRRPLLPWLRRILVNQHFDRLRRAHLEPEAFGQGAACEATPGDAPPRPEAAQPCGERRSRDEHEQIEFLLAQLGEPGRTLLRRFHQGGERIDELAEAFDMPAGTVKSHLHRARRQLAEQFRLGSDDTVLRRPLEP